MNWDLSRIRWLLICLQVYRELKKVRKGTGCRCFHMFMELTGSSWQDSKSAGERKTIVNERIEQENRPQEQPICRKNLKI